MKLISKKIASYLIACTFAVIAIVLPVPANADSYGMGYTHEPTGEAMLADALLIRGRGIIVQDIGFTALQKKS